jgi:hypothetical protein
MKRIYTLLAVASVTLAGAQVPNNGFEETLEDGFTLKSWGTFFPINVEVAPGGEPVQSNPILFDNGIGFSIPVGDCITGSWAMQLSNAFDTQNNVAIPGKVSLFNEAISPTATGWNNGIPLPEGSVVQLLGFDYKFFPMGNDVAVAKLEVFNSGGESIGKAEITMAQTVSDFQYVYVPINFTMNDTPTFMTIDFAMQKDGSEVNSWSTLIVDNVVVNWSMLGVRQNENKPFTVYPTMADNTINIIGNAISGEIEVSVLNVDGKKVSTQPISLNGDAQSLDVSQLASGIYLLDIKSVAGQSVTRFVKK